MGVLLPRSGALAFIGQSCQRGAAYRGVHARERHVRHLDGQWHQGDPAPARLLPFKVVETVSCDRDARDLSVEVAKAEATNAKATNADFILLVSRLNDANLLVRELVKQRWSPQAIISPGSPGMYEAQFYKALGNKYSDHCLSNVPWYDPIAALLDHPRVREAYPGL